jgi:hypothetical protein
MLIKFKKMLYREKWKEAKIIEVKVWQSFIRLRLVIRLIK